ncbi:hypothetical protein DL237_05075 [Pseudooceanicola sediminis]|uniref:DAGKc domain-containing protein n=2 Tax=Pseudooceanicola sediminis TaxID=2211117 RepID=A0A399J6D0_9RHOB|nr:hypothetical protein E0K93_20285 [Puniceibacterium sp. HSS470]RII40107.1 hypothetical protein DL237_05075 [Pseudooceanicola sediminis]
MDVSAAEPTRSAQHPGVEGPITIIANRKSGTNARDADAIDRTQAVFGAQSTDLRYWDPEQDLDALVQDAIDDGARLIVAAGGDGTAMAIASAMLGTNCALAVLPLGTFNYFARGLNLPEDPEAAAEAIMNGYTRDISVGMVNDRVFLNNASLGIYPAILKERETVYARWGRRRLMAHWSVVKTFLQFQRPMHLTITADGETCERRTPLLFVARSAFQLERFGLTGGDAIHHDQFALLVGRGTTRSELFTLAWRLITRTMQEGRDYELICARDVTVKTAKRRALVAFDGEKTRDYSPFEFKMSDDTLKIVLPTDKADSGNAESDTTE